jgi:hypothetical protein
MSISKASAIVGLGFVLLLAALFVPVNRIVYSVSSPSDKYQVRINQKKKAFLGIKAAYLQAWKSNERLVTNKLLYDGDFLDDDFGDRYPNLKWVSDSILAIGTPGSSESQLDNLRITNETLETFNYLLVETYQDKYVIFEVPPGAVVELKFELLGRISCEGESKNNRERFGVAAEFRRASRNREYFVKIRNQGVSIESPRFETTYVPCCAVDRAGFGRD